MRLEFSLRKLSNALKAADLTRKASGFEKMVVVFRLRSQNYNLDNMKHVVRPLRLSPIRSNAHVNSGAAREGSSFAGIGLVLGDQGKAFTFLPVIVQLRYLCVTCLELKCVRKLTGQSVGILF